ncbi:MAG TPA: hypothetical protein VGP76_03530 [Planctomycetaceae bacterium]|jgi:hypothetical protein|nr:hypothetical protein [Planctomycetaceae bacterium]
MYFRKSADIAEAHPELTSDVQQIDDFLYTNEDHPIRSDYLSDTLGIDEHLLRRILDLYASSGTLRRDSRRYCPRCESLIDDDDDPQECDNCEARFSQLTPEQVDVFVSVDPIIRQAFDDAEEDVDVAPLRVQFVGGDRGGGTKNQLQLPKEFGAIKNAIRRSDDPDRLELLNPMFATKVDELGTLYTGKPGLIHFAGHGDERTLSFIKDEELLASTVHMTSERLAKIVGAFPTPVSVIVFNICNSAQMAVDLTSSNVVDIAIGWEGRVTDAAAIMFAEQFYTHLGNGLSVGSAFILASECATPEKAAFRGTMRSRSEIDPKTFYVPARSVQ